jgi:hypothetical protein
VDLTDTLPAGVALGGVFALDVSSAPLPAGITLAANGLLSVTASAAATIAGGLIFSYTTP